MNGRRNLLILLAAFIVLAGAALFQGRQPPPQTSPTSTPGLTLQRIYPEWQVSDIQALRLQIPSTEETLTITRDVDGMWMSAENPGALNQDVVDAMVQAVVSLSYKHTLQDVTSEQKRQFGLTRDGASLFIQVILKNDEQHFIVFGVLIPSGQGLYAQVDEHDTIYVIEREGGAIDFLLHYFNQTQTNS